MQTTVFEANLQWAVSVVRRARQHLPPSFDVADLEQAARIEHWKRSQLYAPSTHVPYQAYALRAVRGAVLMTCRRKEYRERTHEIVRKHYGNWSAAWQSRIDDLMAHIYVGTDQDRCRQQEASMKRTIWAQTETHLTSCRKAAVFLAEREGFEPSIEFPLYTLSKRAPSTTRPSLRGLNRSDPTGAGTLAQLSLPCAPGYRSLYARSNFSWCSTGSAFTSTGRRRISSISSRYLF
jgi:hypothetical protein